MQCVHAMQEPTLPDDAVVNSDVGLVLDEVLQQVTLEDALHLLLMQLRLCLLALITLQRVHQTLTTTQRQTLLCDLLTLTFDL